MKKQFRQVLACIVVTLFTLQPMVAAASSFTRVIPEGSVTFLENGKETGSVKSEVPLPEGLFMLCEGQCLIQSHGFQVLGQNQTIFAISDAGKTLDLTINKGRIDFGIRPNGRLMTIETPHDLIQMEEAFFPASTNLIRGYVVIKDSGAEMGMNEGSVRVVTQKGQHLIQQGHRIQLAQVLPEDQEAAAGAATDAATGAATDAAAGAAAAGAAEGGAAGTILGMSAATAAVVGGAVVVGAVVVFSQDDDDAISPF